MRVMGQIAERRNPGLIAARQVNWRGRSGRFYALLAERMDAFALTTDGLHLLARGTQVMWVGSARDVIDDPQSRARFRLALDCADRAYAVSAGDDELSRMTVVWDLEGAEPVSGLNAA